MIKNLTFVTNSDKSTFHRCEMMKAVNLEKDMLIIGIRERAIELCDVSCKGKTRRLSFV